MTNEEHVDGSSPWPDSLTCGDDYGDRNEFLAKQKSKFFI